jgi:hypothetical protein
MKKFIYVAMLFVFFACGNNKQVNENQSLSLQNHPENDTINRFVVSFISTGSGIDKKAKNDFEGFISMYEQNNKTHISYSKTYPGREGEVNYNFTLSELNSEQQTSFILLSKSQLENCTKVRFFENQSSIPKK